MKRVSRMNYGETLFIYSCIGTLYVNVMVLCYIKERWCYVKELLRIKCFMVIIRYYGLISNSMGQWSDPMMSVWMEADSTCGISLSDTTK